MKTETEPATREELLRENARLRGDLLTVAHRISHDLRTPLGGIVNSGEVVREMLAENGLPSAPLLRPIFDSADDLTRLIERVSFVLKASACPRPLEAVKMGGVVFRVLQRLERRILEKNATVCEPPAWPEVRGVFSSLEVVWGNLLLNALQHGKGRIELGWQKMDGEFQFWIKDNGGGVAPEQQPGLFQPFHVLHRPDAAGGLGLSIVQRLMELQGGSCGYQPLLPGGPIFFFTLAVPGEPSGSSPAPASEKTGGQNILSGIEN